MNMNPTFDAATLQIIWRRLISTVDEASATLMRTSFSTLVRESNDFSCVVTDGRGYLLAQAATSIPSFIGTLPRTVRHFIAELGTANMKPGDVFISNDPWTGTGHLPDINVVKPIFHGGQIVAFAASTAHATDIGGRGGSVEMRDVFEEGFQIPAMKLMDADGPDRTLIALLRANVRAPDEVVGDLYAQVAGLETVEGRVKSLLAEYSLADMVELASEIHGRSEAVMKAGIAAVPNGRYSITASIDSFAQPMTFDVAVSFDGERCTVEFENVPPQVPGSSINSVYAYTAAFTLYALKCVLAPELPNNDGAWRPFDIKVPSGTILNHRFPTSGLWRHYLGHQCAANVLAALAQVLPEKVIAPSGSAPLWGLQFTGVDGHGESFARFFMFNGGMGASAVHDGASALSWPSNISGVPVEYMERLAPLTVQRKVLRAKSGGVGKHRGGLGMDVEFLIGETTPLALAFNGGHLREAAQGLMGGGPGATGEFQINGVSSDPSRMHELKTGDRLTIRTPGGGGFGDPKERDVVLIEADRANGYA